ncbi:putative bifunctional diguanylate cyclase/phosphodiesterase [Roseibium sp.]|uniref:putative bifunctional diguanylate cyclase/phosphodiesterase n=1 Tax=Roseibium sp. TaxID=1936156 RepID=UPI003A972173
MQNGTLNIRRWLAAIVLLLLVPILLFSTLWLRQTLSSLTTLDRSLGGLAAISSLEPALRQAALGTSVMPVPQELNLATEIPLRPNLRAQIADNYQSLITVHAISSAMTEARTIARLVGRAVDLSGAVSLDNGELPDLVSDTLLTVILESSSMLLAGERVAVKDEINLWDRMAITVQGGQFKVAADQVARISKEFFPKKDMPSVHRLQDLAQRYRAANGDYQKAGSQLLRSALEAGRGHQVIVAPVRAEFLALARASLDLWRGAIDHLQDDLQQSRATKRLAVLTASTSSGLVIVFALGMALFLSRKLETKTAKEFNDISLTDPLTGLLNRRGLMRMLLELGSEKDDATAGLLHLDLRRFRAINTRHGEDIGDVVLRTVAQLLSELTQDDDVVVRAGGAEFIIFRRHLTHPSALETLAERIVQSLSNEHAIGSHSIQLDTCIGLSLSQKGSGIGEQLLTDASLALKDAKLKGASNICLFAPHIRLNFERHNEIAKDLRKALEQGHIVPWYQPQICARTGQIVGAEALVRWVGADGSVRPPAAFLPIAEEAGYMDAIDKVVREAAMAKAAKLMKLSHIPFHIGLNVSATVLSEPDCVKMLLEETLAAGLKPQQVSIEILEAVMLDAFDAKPILDNVAALADLGFFIELDDFGTGHASIASLRDLKVDRVKIDRSFVDGVDHDTELQTFTRALIQLARSLGISVLAEGIETEAERIWLTENGCDILQGYFFAKPLPREEITEMVTRQPFALPAEDLARRPSVELRVL